MCVLKDSYIDLIKQLHNRVSLKSYPAMFGFNTFNNYKYTSGIVAWIYKFKYSYIQSWSMFNDSSHSVSAFSAWRHVSVSLNIPKQVFTARNLLFRRTF